ncbi:MAG: hypothetical protein ACKN9Y_02350 [Bacteroidota bacterium]|nr:hypothetical protein [bacterium]NBP64614.1 hypothetical protein [Bacteroidota bacterium]
MTVIYLLLIAASVFLYTISAIVLSQEASVLMVEATGNETIGTLTSIVTGLVLIVGIGFFIVRFVLSRFTKL